MSVLQNARRRFRRSKVGLGAKLAELKLRKAFAGGELHVDYGWIKLLFTDDQDRQELYYHLNQRRWHANDMAVYSRYIEPGSTVVDVGANLGFVTTMLASLVGPTGTVLSCEPSHATYKKLLKTIELNDLRQVIPYNVGIGLGPETLELVSVSKSTGNNTLVPSALDSAPHRETVRIMALDELPELRTRKVALIKVDTEGYEFPVLDGAKSTIMRDKPTIHTELGGGGGYADSTLKVIELLDQLNYDVRPVSKVDWGTVGNGVDFVFRPRGQE